MSENQKINDEMIFQSFSKNYIFDSNKEPNKTSQNENIEFTFRKNLFLQKSEESPPKNNQNKNENKCISAFDDQKMEIYSKNDNIQESGHFGKSKYDSSKYKNIIEKNCFLKQPLSFIDTNLCGKNTKTNFNIKKLEKEESKLFNDKLKKVEIKKYKSSAKMNSSVNYSKKINSSNGNKIKKIKPQSTYYYKGNHLDNNPRNKDNKNYGNEEFIYLDGNNTDNYKGNNLIINRLKKINDNNYLRDVLINDSHRTCNNSINTQIIGDEIKIFNKYCNLNSTNRYINKCRKITIGRINDVQTKLSTNSLNTFNKPKQITINSKIYKENKENIPININNRDMISNTKKINNTIMNYNHNISPNYKRMKINNSINERIPYNPQKISKTKTRNDKRENIIRKYSDAYIKLNETKFNYNNNDILSSTTYFGNMLKNKISRANRIKNNESLYCNKINTVDSISIGISKTKINRSIHNVSRDIAPTKKILIKSYFIKDNFGF